jgi:hypothetical protein
MFCGCAVLGKTGKREALNVLCLGFVAQTLLSVLLGL